MFMLIDAIIGWFWSMEFFTALIVDVTQRSVPEGVLDCRELRMRVGWARRREGSPKTMEHVESGSHICRMGFLLYKRMRGEESDMGREKKDK
jgi:hypothetical protein